MYHGLNRVASFLERRSTKISKTFAENMFSVSKEDEKLNATDQSIRVSI